MNNLEPGFIVNIYNENVSVDLYRYLKPFTKDKLIVMCIGTDKCIGDCLAPLIGTLLTKSNFKHMVIGTLENPVHALNVENIIKDTLCNYSDYFIIAIDACVGDSERIGDIQVRSAPIYPGKGVGKTLPQIGDISIVGVVDSFGNPDLFTIKTIRLGFIMQMAEIIANALISALD